LALHQPGGCDCDAAAAVDRLGVAEEDAAVVLEVMVEPHIHEPGLAARKDVRNAGDRLL
jgi:hypothetical protein